MYGPLLFGLLIAIGVLVGFALMWQLLTRRDPVEARLEEYGVDTGQPVGAVAEPHTAQRRPAWDRLNRLLSGFGFGARLATSLARADLPLTAAEFSLIIVVASLAGFVIGALRGGLLLGAGLAVLLGVIPIIYLRFKQNRRLRAFTEQLPDVLTLLVGGLRAGYGLTQALEMIADELPAPASTEFARVLRAVQLGVPVQRALNDMANRVGSDDLALVVTAINVQYEMGGNLAHTLETISVTVRDRLTMLREIRVMTAQQRFTGYFLAIWPFLIALAIFAINPDHMMHLFEPGWIRLLPIIAICMQIAGFLVIRRIVDIEV